MHKGSPAVSQKGGNKCNTHARARAKFSSKGADGKIQSQPQERMSKQI